MVEHGICIGNARREPLDEILDRYDADAHSILRVLMADGPLGLTRLPEANGFRLRPEGYLDKCHLCHEVRDHLRPAFPDFLAPDACYPVSDNVARFGQLAAAMLRPRDVVLRNAHDPFEMSLACGFEGIGDVTIEPFGERQFEAFRAFYDRRDSEWDLSAASRSLSDQHDTQPATLQAVAQRVSARQDARFVIVTQGHVIGYLDIEEIDRIQAGMKTYSGETHYAMLDIAISDRFHGTGLAALAMLFLKLVAAQAQVGLGLVTSPVNRRAQRFYAKHGFIESGAKPVPDIQTGQPQPAPWFVLKRNELEGCDTLIDQGVGP